MNKVRLPLAAVLLAFVSCAASATSTAPKLSMWFNPGSVPAGKNSTLHWSASNVTECTAGGAWSGDEPVSGTQTVTTTAVGNTTYTLTCTGANGDITSSATLQAVPPAPTAYLGINPGTIVLGKKTTLKWSSSNATSCSASGAWSGTLPTSGSQSETPTSAGNYTYTLTCTGAGGSASSNASLQVTPPLPTVKFEVSPGSIVLGSKATLTWSSTNATACTAGGAWSGSEATSGKQAVVPTAVGNSNYTLTCTGGGGSTTGSANLTVTSSSTPAPTLSIGVSPNSVAIGASPSLTWSSTDTTSCTAGGAWSGSQGTSGSLAASTTTPGSYTYTLNCTGPGGSGSNSATLIVNALPTLSISVSPAIVTVGQSSALTWSSANTTACTASGAWSGSQNTSGTFAPSTATPGSYIYTLNCSGAGGSTGGSATLTVNAAQALVTTIDAGVTPTAVTINQGTAIGQGSLNGATPYAVANATSYTVGGVTHTDSNNFDTVTSSTNPFQSVGTVPDTAFGFCDYSGSTPKRVSYVTGSKVETTSSDPRVSMSPYYFPLVYNTKNTTSGNAFGGKPPIIGLFDWRPKDIDESLVAAESDDNGKTWYFMQSVLELFPDYTNPISGGYSASSTNTGCPAAVNQTNASNVSVNNSTADDGWGHAAIIQLPGLSAATGQFLYMLDRSPNNVDVAPLWVIQLAPPAGGTNGGSTNKFPIWNSNNTAAGANDIKSISTALVNSSGAAAAHNTVLVQQTNGLLDPDGIMAVFPTSATALTGSAVTVMYVQKILNGDNTGSTAMPTAQQCKKAPFSGKTNHDISNVRLASTTDGINFTDLGVVNGLNDPTTVDYNKTRWVAPRGTLIDINGDGSRWGLYFSAGNCLDGDSDAFHYIGYAESSDMVNWTVYNDINSPIASINTITTANQSNGATVTIPANTPLFPTQPWFAQRLYAPTATQIDSTHLSLTFAGYGVQTPSADLLNYRQIGNIVLTVSKALPAGVPNNINAH